MVSSLHWPGVTIPLMASSSKHSSFTAFLPAYLPECSAIGLGTIVRPHHSDGFGCVYLAAALIAGLLAIGVIGFIKLVRRAVKPHGASVFPIV
jgi:hypothetical protein